MYTHVQYMYCVHVHVHVQILILVILYFCLFLSSVYIFLPSSFSHTPLLFPFSLFPLSLSLSRFTKPRQFAKSDNNGSESPPGKRRSFSNKRSSFVMSAGTGGRRRSFSLRVEEQRRNEAEGFSTT